MQLAHASSLAVLAAAPWIPAASTVKATFVPSVGPLFAVFIFLLSRFPFFSHLQLTISEDTDDGNATFTRQASRRCRPRKPVLDSGCSNRIVRHLNFDTTSVAQGAGHARKILATRIQGAGEEAGWCTNSGGEATAEAAAAEEATAEAATAAAAAAEAATAVAATVEAGELGGRLAERPAAASAAAGASVAAVRAGVATAGASVAAARASVAAAGASGAAARQVLRRRGQVVRQRDQRASCRDKKNDFKKNKQSFFEWGLNDCCGHRHLP